MRAAFGAAAAGVSAILHITKRVAALRAGFTDIGANTAHGSVVLRSISIKLAADWQDSAQAGMSRKCVGSTYLPPASKQ